MNELISIIVATYNMESYLRRCIDSLLKQTYRNIEILLIDDCSTDGSAAIAREYAQLDSRCRFIQLEKNGRQAAARNIGLKEAKGEWLSFVDSDDWVTEDYISAMYDIAKQDEADIVMSSIYYWYPNGRYEEVSPFADLTTESSHKEKVALSRAYSVTRLFRKSFVDATNIVFPTNIWRALDQGFTVPLLTRTEKVSILRKPLYYYFQRPNSNSNQNHKQVDVSFFPRSVQNVENNSASGFETELEFRAIHDLMYGMIMIMVRSGRSSKEIAEQIEWFNKKYSNWRRNPYFTRLPKGKQVFIDCARKKWITALRMLNFAWNAKQKFQKKV